MFFFLTSTFHVFFLSPVVQVIFLGGQREEKRVKEATPPLSPPHTPSAPPPLHPPLND